MVGGSAQLLLLVGLGTGLMISWSDLRIPLANSLCYQGLVAVMGYELSREMLRASRLAQDLRASEARSLAILRAVPDLMFLQSLDGVYLDYHASRPDRLFVPPESFLGKNMREVLPPAVLSAVEPAFVKAAGGAETVVVEYEIPMPHGDRIVRGTAGPQRERPDPHADPRCHRSRRAEAALLESQQRYTLAAAAGAVGVWDWNFETNELFVDPGLKAILGFDDREISTRPDDWGSRVHPEDLAGGGRRRQELHRWHHRYLRNRASDAAQGWQREVDAVARVGAAACRRQPAPVGGHQGRHHRAQAGRGGDSREPGGAGGQPSGNPRSGRTADRVAGSRAGPDRARLARRSQPADRRPVDRAQRHQAAGRRHAAGAPIWRATWRRFSSARSGSPRTSATSRTTCIRACSSTPAWSPR